MERALASSEEAWRRRCDAVCACACVCMCVCVWVEAVESWRESRRGCLQEPPSENKNGGVCKRPLGKKSQPPSRPEDPCARHLPRKSSKSRSDVLAGG